MLVYSTVLRKIHECWCTVLYSEKYMNVGVQYCTQKNTSCWSTVLYSEKYKNDTQATCVSMDSRRNDLNTAGVSFEFNISINALDWSEQGSLGQLALN